MISRKHISITLLLVVAVSVMTSAVTALLLTKHYSHVQFQRLGDLSGAILQQQPEVRQTLFDVLKEYTQQPMAGGEENILLQLGYGEKHFSEAVQGHGVLLWGISLAMGIGLFLAAFWLWYRYEVSRIRALTGYLERVNAGGMDFLCSISEDEYAKLQDEIYKTVTALHQTRDEAVKARQNYAENLSNIAHQLKTPITAMSLSTQMMGENPSPDYPVQIQKQLKRLTHLEEALLLLSRIDAGTLTLQRESVDVFTVLTLAADHLWELYKQKGVLLDLPDMEEMEITADLDWTMEAIINLLKNCMEHTPAGKTVHCACQLNPLYTQIQIWDEGPGFRKEDIPHVFERFYRGHNTGGHGIGIGLSLAKAIIEMQNGVISAGNTLQGGACFEIRIYRH